MKRYDSYGLEKCPRHSQFGDGDDACHCHPPGWLNGEAKLARDVLSLVERLEAAESGLDRAETDGYMRGYAAGRDFAHAELFPEVVAAEARAARYEEAGKKLRRAVEWAICEDLNGVICSQPFNPGNDAFGMGDDAKPPRQPCPSCEAGWKLMRESSEEWDAALSGSVPQEEEEGE